MARFFVDPKKAPEELAGGLKIIAADGWLNVSGEKNGFELVFNRETGGDLAISGCAGKINIKYESINDAFRSLGIINSRTDKELKNLKIKERRRFKNVYLMMDASRNAVLNRDSVIRFFKFMALAGVNGFMFYTEDTYEVPGEKMFGYMRGKLTIKELKEYDNLAANFGIELIPCIQTLAHLARILSYECYRKIKDTSVVMLCKKEETYKFIEKIIKAAVKPFRSRRIHIGMDEAGDLGRGAFLDRYGYEKPFDIMTGHLGRVLAITRKLGLQPMMWSDMFFRALSKDHVYHAPDVVFTEKMKKRIPADVDLVYWCYSRFKESEYAVMTDKHIELGGVPVFATGIWSWGRFWTTYEQAEKTMGPGLKNAVKKGVKDVIVTIWGDDGTECDFFSAMPMIQYAADINFTGKADRKYTEKNLKGTLGIDFSDWRKAALIDQPPVASKHKNYFVNISKGLLWEDPLLGLWQPELCGESVNGFYKKLSADLKKIVKKKGNERLCVPFLLSELLALKGDLPAILQGAYRRRDIRKLKEISLTILPAVIRKTVELNKAHRKMWHKNYKALGWEVLERRYGSLLNMLEYSKEMLDAYLKGKIDKIEQLEERKEKIIHGQQWGTLMNDKPGYICSASQAYSTGYVAL